jgi:hypothetical protein
MAYYYSYSCVYYPHNNPRARVESPCLSLSLCPACCCLVSSRLALLSSCLLFLFLVRARHAVALIFVHWFLFMSCYVLSACWFDNSLVVLMDEKSSSKAANSRTIALSLCTTIVYYSYSYVYYPHNNPRTSVLVEPVSYLVALSCLLSEYGCYGLTTL